MKKDAIIVGYSGHAYVVIDILLLRNYNIIGYFDQEDKINNPYQLSYLGSENRAVSSAETKGVAIFFGIGDNRTRSRLFERLSADNFLMPYLVHPSSNVSATAEVAEGTVLMAGAAVNALSKIGKGVICNTSSVIEHGCEVGDFAHIGPGAVLAGNVSVGDHTFIGANSVVRQGIRIGKNVIVGAGTVVVKDIEDGTIVYGNPGALKL